MSNEIIPSSFEIVKEAIKNNPNVDINTLHSKTFELIKKYRKEYYKNKVNFFLSRKSLANIPKEIKTKIEKELLKPIKIGDKEYSNFMEETSRRISQTFQVISGNIAELCVERELIKVGLKLGVHYDKKVERTDFIIYYPKKQSFRKKHRIEVKNVKLRERGTRGLAFDGDSMIGFFNQPSEFTASNVEVIDNHCKKTGGYCYVPPQTLKLIKHKNSRFKSNIEFAKDMKKFVETGSI
jgi:hypothetical protein